MSRGSNTPRRNRSFVREWYEMKKSNIGTTHNNNFYISIIKDEIQSLEKQIKKIGKVRS